jgi:hypothetical protein
MPQRFIVSMGSSTIPDEWTDFRVTNTLYYQGVQGADSGLAVAQAIADAYAETNTLGFVFGAIQVKAYDFDGVLPSGAPVAVATADQPGPLPAVGPREVCVCLSYRAGPGPRGRGRIYLGPVPGTNTSGEYVAGTPGNEANALGLRLSNILTLGAQWSLYSRRAMGFASILSWSVDNAWDTQRSRGLPATALF